MSVASLNDELQQVLVHYGLDARTAGPVPLETGYGFSGAQLWRIATPRGEACLRRWPAEHPTRQRLEFIQAVLWHVDQEGYRQVAVPWETTQHAGYVAHAGHLWEVTPWIAGHANYRRARSQRKLEAAMAALAGFHLAASSFPLPDSAVAVPQTVTERAQRTARLTEGGLEVLASHVRRRAGLDLAQAEEVLDLAARSLPAVSQMIERATSVRAPILPAIRDVWHDHVIFVDEEVAGIVDFGALRPDTAAADIARLLGSLVDDDLQGWRAGLEAYGAARALTLDELALVEALDRASVLLSPLQWIEWLYVEQRQFGDPARVGRRLEELLVRLRHMAGVRRG